MASIFGRLLGVDLFYAFQTPTKKLHGNKQVLDRVV